MHPRHLIQRPFLLGIITFSNKVKKTLDPNIRAHMQSENTHIYKIEQVFFSFKNV
jgi:hypothetical protein